MFELILQIISDAGYGGIAALMFLENVFPPIPSELIMPLAGFLAAQGKLNAIGVIAAGTAGAIAGVYFWYFVAMKFGLPRLKSWVGRNGRWLTMTPDELDQAASWFQKHGIWAVFICRLIPALRTLISIPAGIARMPLVPFLVVSAVGSFLWTALLTGAGYLLEANYEQVEQWMGPVSKAVLLLMVSFYLYRVVTFKPASTEH